MSAFTSPGPYHILTYGTLLGSNVLQSFFLGLIQFKTLPRPQFSQLQQATFPIFFGLQTALPLVVALTYPEPGLVSGRSTWSPRALFAPENRWGALVPLAVAFVTAAANWVWCGPATTKVMRLRKHQETRDGKKAYDKGPHTPEMEKLNREFAFLHGTSTIINLVGFVAQVWYGFTLGARL